MNLSKPARASAIAAIASLSMSIATFGQDSTTPAHKPTAMAIGSKGTIENPFEKALYKRTSLMDPRLIPPLARSAPRPSMQAALDQMGPKESPGLVSWHKHMGEAGAASARSGKPILLVHVLGNLDDHFC